MYVCIYVCMYVCMCKNLLFGKVGFAYNFHHYVYVCHVCMYVCMYVCLIIDTSVVCVLTTMSWVAPGSLFMFSLRYVCMHVCICMCIYACAFVCV